MYAVGGSAERVEESTQRDDSVQLTDGDQLLAVLRLLELLQLHDVFVKQSPQFLDQSLVLLAFQPTVHVRPPAKVRDVAVDHAAARYSGWRRHGQITHLKQQRYLQYTSNNTGIIQVKTIQVKTGMNFRSHESRCSSETIQYRPK